MDNVTKGLQLIGKEMTKGSPLTFTVNEDMLVLTDGKKELTFKGVIETYSKVETIFDLTTDDSSEPALSEISVEVDFMEEAADFEKSPKHALKDYFEA